MSRWPRLAEAEALVYETIDLAERELGVRLNRARAALAERRQPANVDVSAETYSV